MSNGKHSTDEEEEESSSTFEHRSNIQLSDHVKSKLRPRPLTPSSVSSDEVFFPNLSESVVSPSPLNPRSNTFTTYQIQAAPVKPKPFSTQESCKECQRREELLREKHRRVLHLESEDRKLTEQLRSTVLLTSQYQEENYQLKHHLHRLNAQLRQQQSQNDVQSKKDKSQVDHLQRLRHEVYVYSQVMAAKRQAEAGQSNDYSGSM